MSHARSLLYSSQMSTASLSTLSTCAPVRPSTGPSARPLLTSSSHGDVSRADSSNVSFGPMAETTSLTFTALCQHTLEWWQTSAGARRWRRKPSQDSSHWFTRRSALMFRSTLTIDAVGVVATPEASTMCTKPCVWQTIVVVAHRVRPCAFDLTCLCSSFLLHTSRFCLTCPSLL